MGKSKLTELLNNLKGYHFQHRYGAATKYLEAIKGSHTLRRALLVHIPKQLHQLWIVWLFNVRKISSSLIKPLWLGFLLMVPKVFPTNTGLYFCCLILQSASSLNIVSSASMLKSKDVITSFELLCNISSYIHPTYYQPVPPLIQFWVILDLFSTVLVYKLVHVSFYTCDKVSLAIFSSGIASYRAQIFSTSLTIDVARYFCLPLQSFSLPGKLNLWTTSKDLDGFIQWRTPEEYLR